MFVNLTEKVSLINFECSINDTNLLNQLQNEENTFTDPYKGTWIKIIAILCYLIGIPMGKTVFSYIINEAEEQNKTIINLLIVFLYFMVSDITQG